MMKFLATILPDITTAGPYRRGCSCDSTGNAGTYLRFLFSQETLNHV